jgi:hypothetical protein
MHRRDCPWKVGCRPRAAGGRKPGLCTGCPGRSGESRVLWAAGAGWPSRAHPRPAWSPGSPTSPSRRAYCRRRRRRWSGSEWRGVHGWVSQPSTMLRSGLGTTGTSSTSWTLTANWAQSLGDSKGLMVTPGHVLGCPELADSKLRENRAWRFRLQLRFDAHDALGARCSLRLGVVWSAPTWSSRGGSGFAIGMLQLVAIWSPVLVHWPRG